MPRFLRFASPATLALALIVFALPFVSVSCDTPGGFGQMTPGGTTSYTGVDLALGTSPEVTDDHQRPEAERADDDLGVQPLMIIAALGIAIALGLAFARRFQFAAIAAAVGWVALVIGLLVARSALVDMVVDQMTEPFPDDKSASDYVGIGIGFWLAVILSAIGAVLSAVAGRMPPSATPVEHDTT